jgi:glutamate/tyrosine decarboxylase-like PLP-dependent enzyme
MENQEHDVTSSTDPRQVLARALDLALEYLEQEKQLPALAGEPERLRAELGIGINPAGLSLDQVISKLGKLLAQTPSSASRRYLNQLFGGRDAVATLAEMLVPVVNCSMYTFKAAGPNVLVEQELISRMAARVGYPAGEGIFTPGGSLSNLTAMIVARNEAVAGVRDEGLAAANLVVYASDQAHYSIRKNAGILGIGRRQVRPVASDSSTVIRARGKPIPGACVGGCGYIC